jgi:protein involved in temperature-dependent protein secretion
LFSEQTATMLGHDAFRTLGGPVSASNDSPEWAALLLASDAYRRASSVRSALGGYVPLNHPGHPSKWNRRKRAALADADDNLAAATEAMRLAAAAHAALT